MIPLEHFTASLALSVVLAFVAGAGFGAWLTLKCLSRIYTQISKPQISYAGEPPRPFPSEVKLSPEEIENIKIRVAQDNGPNTFERTPP